MNALFVCSFLKVLATKSCPVNGGVEYSCIILDLGSSGGEWLASIPGRFIQWDAAPVIHRIGGCVGPVSVRSLWGTTYGGVNV
jgi:hypothetical protein